jgi:two-component system sensor kinase FixL
MKNQQEAVLAALLNAAVDAIIVMDAQGIVRVVNAAVDRMFGYHESEVVGKNIRMLMPSPYREHHDGYLTKYRNEGKRNIIGIGREVQGQRKDGTLFPLHLAVSELEHDGTVLFAGILRDITDLKVAQDELATLNARLEQRVSERTEQLKATQEELVRREKLATLGQISGGIAHEIRNPLNAVKTSIYFLQHARELSDEKRNEHLQRIDRQVTAIDSVVSALTDMVRLPTPKCTACCARKILTEAVENSSLGNRIAVDYSIADNLPPLWVDPNQLQIVFRNIVRNARDAMPDGGKLKLEARIATTSNAQPSDIDGRCQADKTCTHETNVASGGVANQLIQIQITDTGTGIAADRLSQIMEPFVSTKARGMGLGLAITKAMVEKNSGTVAVESTLGKGTSFLLTLPAAATSCNTNSDPCEVFHDSHTDSRR